MGRKDYVLPGHCNRKCCWTPFACAKKGQCKCHEPQTEYDRRVYGTPNNWLFKPLGKDKQ